MNFSHKLAFGLLLAVFCWSCANNKKSTPGPVTICLTPADSANISFARDINPIIQNQCTSCHNSVTANGGFIFENYNQISSKSNEIYSAMTATNGFQQMPQSGRLSNCDIEKMNTWIKNGKPNN